MRFYFLTKTPNIAESLTLLALSFHRSGHYHGRGAARPKPLPKPNIVKPISFHCSGHYHCADMGRPNKHGENLTLWGRLVPPLGALSWPQNPRPNAESAKPNNVRLWETKKPHGQKPWGKEKAPNNVRGWGLRGRACALLTLIWSGPNQHLRLPKP